MKTYETKVAKEFQFRSINKIEKALKIIKQDSKLAEILNQSQAGQSSIPKLNFLAQGLEGPQVKPLERQRGDHLTSQSPGQIRKKNIWDYSHKQYLNKTFDLRGTNYKPQTPREEYEEYLGEGSEATDQTFAQDYETEHPTSAEVKSKAYRFALGSLRQSPIKQFQDKKS